MGAWAAWGSQLRVRVLTTLGDRPHPPSTPSPPHTFTPAPPPRPCRRYVRLHTTLGDLNIELHCDVAPKTCENFIALCEGG